MKYLSTKEEKLMEAIETVQELTRENNFTLTFYSKLEKSITKDTLEAKQLLQIKKKKKERRSESNNENSKYHLQEKEIPTEKVYLSSTMEQKYTISRKSDAILDEAQ